MDADGTLNEQTKKWRRAAQEMLEDIRAHDACINQKTGGKYTIGELLAAFNIEPELLNYDQETEDFADEE